ncbi:hypothetical protein Vretifemale_16862 [Volvox reticuliferus]|uniref:Uncharacterized protein n=1 Tax=Volvox reticuliferus TaxID=1737510 RepID=A0A8J4CSD9_9CHLO|nr:hypothetical protein Vretifemale_16862 [Volvox reticuliferus]
MLTSYYDVVFYSPLCVMAVRDGQRGHMACSSSQSRCGKKANGGICVVDMWPQALRSGGRQPTTRHPFVKLLTQPAALIALEHSSGRVAGPSRGSPYPSCVDAHVWETFGSREMFGIF